MNRYLPIGIIILFSLSLFGCVHKNPNPDTDFSNETWQRELSTDSNRWLSYVDSWFLTGDANIDEQSNRHAPASAAISSMTVRVPDDFNTIKVDGAFQVQIFGTDEHNSVYVVGQNAGVRNVAVDVHGNTLEVRQTQYVPPSLMKSVIIRIGIRNLRNLVQRGCGSIEAIRIRSHNLRMLTTSTSSGNVVLAGFVNLTRVVHAGSGALIVLGAKTQSLSIVSMGSGPINIGGCIGIRSIIHQGSGDINIIGADSPSLKVDAGGAGKIGIVGRVNLTEAYTRNNARVYISSVLSNNLLVAVYDNARMGLAGSVRNLTVNISDTAVFGGRYLCAQSAYVRAHDMSHINITASAKAFASATQNSSVYFFGPENLLTEFDSRAGTVIPMDEVNWCNARSEYRSYDYTLSSVGETIAVKPGYRLKAKRRGHRRAFVGEG